VNRSTMTMVPPQCGRNQRGRGVSLEATPVAACGLSGWPRSPRYSSALRNGSPAPAETHPNAR
jgi:hypothetical protein